MGDLKHLLKKHGGETLVFSLVCVSFCWVLGFFPPQGKLALLWLAWPFKHIDLQITIIFTLNTVLLLAGRSIMSVCLSSQIALYKYI